MTTKTKAQKDEEQRRARWRTHQVERAHRALEMGNGSGVGASHFKATLEFSYLDFQNMAALAPAALYEKTEALRKEARQKLGIMWSSEPTFTFSDIFGVPHDWHLFQHGYEIWGGNARLKLTDVYEERVKVFADIVDRATRLGQGGHPCTECGVESPARAGVGDLCTDHWEIYLAKNGGDKVPRSQQCCPKAYNVFCVCVNKRYCPDHGSSCMGSHD